MNEHDPSSAGQLDPALANLEQRLHRLESAVASLQDTRALEERVAERLRRGTPTAVAPGVAADDRIQDGLRPSAPLVGKATLAPAASTGAVTGAPRPWLIFDMWAEFRTIIYMFFNVRYHVAWYARLAVLVLIPAILTSQWWLLVPDLFGLKWILEKLVDLLLAFVLYKTLSREAYRYQEWKSRARGISG